MWSRAEKRGGTCGGVPINIEKEKENKDCQMSVENRRQKGAGGKATKTRKNTSEWGHEVSHMCNRDRDSCDERPGSTPVKKGKSQFNAIIQAPVTTRKKRKTPPAAQGRREREPSAMARNHT